MNKIFRNLLIGVILIITGGYNQATFGKDLVPPELLSGIQNILAEGWSYTVINEPGEMGHPHGLEEPAFRIDFINTKQEITSSNPNRKVNPYLRLHFHKISEKEKILDIIKKEMIYSWDIPVYFAETKNFIIITSMWTNQGIHTKKANESIAPLEKTLKDYFEKLK